MKLLLENGAEITEHIKYICGEHGDTQTAKILSEVILQKVIDTRK